ncbi:cytochrome c [Filomicrobium insigne]|uniref:Cytochrome c n=1 Tax=Filomicrobium insigne TaxID=418854 RepID=A0A1H0HSR0_9HYPH|nr:c-type cytochrome [Filomicrobium insigne]SDO22178.1 cytochrome c [Filomicrobium insigne]
MRHNSLQARVLRSKRLAIWSAVWMLVALGTLAGPAVATGGAADSPATGTSSAKAMQAPAPKGLPDASERRSAHGNLVGHGGPVKAISVDRAHERVLTGSFDYAMMLWDVSGEKVDEGRRFDEHDGAVNAVAFVGEEGKKALAAGDDGVLVLWDLENGKALHRFSGHKGKIVGLAVSPGGRWAATASWDHTARLWDLERLVPGPVLEGHRGPVNDVEFSANGADVYTAGYDGEIRLFKVTDGAYQRPIYRLGWGINVLARLPGTENLAFGGLNGTAGVVSARTGEVVAELKSSERPILSLAATDKPGLLATGGADGTVRVYRSADFTLIEEYQNPYGPIWAMNFASDGKRIYLGGLDDFVTAWQITPRQPFEPIDSPYPRRFQLSEASDDPLARGRIQFARKCSVCHTLKPDGKNRAGPTLYGIFGRKIAALPGYPYSEPLKDLDIIWTEETVSKLFELGPDVFTPGSKMPLQKMTDPEQRDDLISYLKEATRPGGSDKLDEKNSDPKKPSAPANELGVDKP